VNWTHIRILYLRELRSALRERTIVINSILMPIFLYPVLLWFMFTGITFVQGLSEGRTSRVALFEADAPAQVDPGEFRERLSEDATIEVQVPPSLDAAREALSAGDLDAIVEFGPGATAEDLSVAVSFDGAVDRSRRARDRIREAVDEVRSGWLEARSGSLGIAEPQRELFEVRSHNVSSEDELGAMLLGQMLSLFIVIMVALGCFIPSVDTTAGERERSTWETLMTVSASRSSVIASKYLYVATLGILAGLLNVAAMFASIGAIIRPLMDQGDRGLSFALPTLALPVMMLGAVGLALFFAAAMMILASFARTFKDGQAMVQPVYWLVFVPMLLGQQSDTTLTPAIAAIPVANVAMMIRDAMNGVFLWPLIFEVLAVTAVTVVACLWIARQILRFEDHLLGSYDGSFWRFAKQRLFSASSNSPAS
jgi:sodium transport system permease protein